MREDILRGLRFGTLLLAILLAAIAAYRVMRESPGPVPVKTEKPPRVSAPARVSQPVTVSPGPSIPPPPPQRGSRNGVARKPAVHQEIEVAQSDPAPAMEQDQPKEPESADSDNPEPPETPSAAAEKQEPEPAAEPAPGTRPAGRASKTFKAVGRLLHIGGKKATSQ